MRETPPSDKQRRNRSTTERSGDHAAIDRLSTELLPALIAKLGATGLGELEVREGTWRVRLRAPQRDPHGAGGTPGTTRDRRPSGRSGPDGVTADRTDRHERSERSARLAHPAEAATPRAATRSVATSPAVGIYRPRADLVVGERVRAGDRLGAVDMLGVPQEVLAPDDGVVGASLAESGDAVEYGQELLVIEMVPAPAASS